MSADRTNRTNWWAFAAALVAYTILTAFFSLLLLVTPCASAGATLPPETPECGMLRGVLVVIAATAVAIAVAAAWLHVRGSSRAIGLLFAGSIAPLIITLAVLLLR